LPRLLRARIMIPVSVVLAAVSLVIVRSPTFDVWAWLVWGREIAHLDLDTSWGPQFKPLPVAVTTLASPFGGLEVPIWMLLSRAAGFLALAAIARLAWRSAGTVAAIIAATSLVSVHLFSVYLMPFGMSEPMLVAFLLWAVDRHLAGRHTAAVVLLVGASLLRVEPWPFLLGDALLTYHRRQVRPAVLAASLLIVPVAWFLPEWWGSGHPLRAGNGSAVPGGPSLQAHPGLAVVTGTVDDLLAWVWIGAALGLAWAIRARDRLMLGMAAAGAVWLGIVAVLTQAGVSSGVSRYLIGTHAVLCLLAGVGWVRAAQLVRDLLAATPRVARFAPAVLVVVLAVPSLITYRGWLRDGAREVRHQEAVYEAANEAVSAAGGPAAAKGCAKYVWTRPYRESQVAWLMHVHLSEVQSWAVPGRPASDYVGVMVQIVDRPGDQLLPGPMPFLSYRVAGRAVRSGIPVVVLSPCGA
jgi:hypothetical protein